MELPAPVTAALGDEEVAARVPLKGEDALFVTPTRTLVYSGEGLLSDESVEAFPHDAERVEATEGRRKAKLSLDYGLDGEREFAVPPANLEEALHPVLAGVLSAAGVTDAGETVTRTYRFSELTLVVTSHRVVKHVGAAVWDDEYEEIAYDDVTGIDVEEGNVASQLVIETRGRNQRIKVPNEQARDVRERVEEALLAYHDVASYEAFAELMAADEEPDPEPAAAPGAATFESDLDPIDLSDPDDEEVGDAGPGATTGESPTAGADGTASDATTADRTTTTADSAATADGAAGETAEASATDAATTDAESTGDADASTELAAVGEELAESVDDPTAQEPTGGGESGEPEPADQRASAPRSADRGTAGQGQAGQASATGRETAATRESTATREATAGEETTRADAGDVREDPGEGTTETGAGFEEFESAVAEPADVREELVALRRSIERQREQLARQAELVEAIAEELDGEE